MSLRQLLTRASVAFAATLVGVLAVVGGVSLHGAGVLAVALAGVVAGCLGAGIARENPVVPLRRTVADAAWRAGVGTVAGLLVLAGSAVLAGRAAPVLVLACVGAVALAWWARRSAPTGPPPGGGVPSPGGVTPPRPGVPPSAGAAPGGGPSSPAGPTPAVPAAALPPAAGLSVEELGREWRRTAAVLESAADAAERAVVVRRRGEVLDELERRDPAGFARWLAGGASADGYPVRRLRGDSSTGPGSA
ncbi:hypothetical protein [Modestobacter lapidis]|nr:hypothetical protein [Modestobacter lapidis]